MPNARRTQVRAHVPTRARSSAARRRLVLASLATVASLSACGGDDDGGSNASTPTRALPQQNAATCAALTGTTVAASAIGEPSRGATITSATYVAATVDTPNGTGTAIVQALPDYCRVLVDVAPVDVTAPTVKAEVNLPTYWNGKKLQLGGSGFNGTLVTGLGAVANAGPDTPLPMIRGYMTAGTDSGHQAAAGVEAQAFALNAEALVNFAYASYKKTHDVAVSLAVTYYGRAPVRSYYAGGSEGGREAMTMAQRYPADYDAIFALDPVMNWTALQTAGNQDGGIDQVGAAWLGTKIGLVHATVAAACDGLDGIVDGVVSNYGGCKAAADPALAAIACPGGNDSGPTCLSNAQLAAVNALHAPYTFPFPLANGVTQYAGWGYGGEALPGNWSAWVTGTVAPVFTVAPNVAGLSNIFSFGNGTIRYFIAQDANFNPLAYDPAAFRPRVQAVSAIMDATNPDLSAFFARGGVLILKEDLADYAQSPYTGLNYYDAVTARLGASTVAASFKAYASPGLSHTSGGFVAGTANAPSYGIPGRIDWLAILDAWSSNGTAPAAALTLTLPAALPPYASTVSKPLCAYPNYPRFTGTSPATGNLASSYACTPS